VTFVIACIARGNVHRALVWSGAAENKRDSAAADRVNAEAGRQRSTTGPPQPSERRICSGEVSIAATENPDHDVSDPAVPVPARTALRFGTRPLGATVRSIAIVIASLCVDLLPGDVQ
jgi:hypothetical protein